MHSVCLVQSDKTQTTTWRIASAVDGQGRRQNEEKESMDAGHVRRADEQATVTGSQLLLSGSPHDGAASWCVRELGQGWYKRRLRRPYLGLDDTSNERIGCRSWRYIESRWYLPSSRPCVNWWWNASRYYLKAAEKRLQGLRITPWNRSCAWRDRYRHLRGQ